MFQSKIKNLHEVWNDISFEEKRNILITIIDKIIIKEDEIEIYYNNLI